MIQPFARRGVNPNTLTLVGLLLSILTAVVIAQGLLVAGGLLVLFAGMFDMLDGAMARVQNAATTFGAFLDSTLDRYSESIILTGLLYHVLQNPGLHDIVWPFPYEQSWMIGFIYVAVVGSLMVSYTKARAEGLGLECKNGLLARPERVILLAIGLLSGTYIWALAVLAVFSQVTAIERIVHVWLTTSRAAKIETQRASPEMLNTLPVAYNADTDNRQKLTILERTETIEPSVLPVHPGVPPFNRGVQHE
jgi:CDP-diacylglycerol---glycerol-3-phosphate 3-phosphatidyltransferase